MAIPKLQEVIRATFALDGGSTCLYVLDDTGEMHQLELVQHLIPLNSSVRRKFGRLYFDDCLIDVRSSDEAAIIDYLRSVTDRSRYSLEVEGMLTFLQSDEYVQLAR